MRKERQGVEREEPMFTPYTAYLSSRTVTISPPLNDSSLSSAASKS